MALLLTVLLTALVFEYINGFHDTANSIATVVSTKVLTPRMAIFLAVAMNLWGALSGVAVAKTISGGLVNASFVDSPTIIAALIGAIVWNLITWYFGLPSSSSHALVGGLCGATLATAHNQMSALIWFRAVPGKPLWNQDGLLPKVIFPMIASPLIGFVGGFILMSLLYLLVAKWRVSKVGRTFGTMQILSAGYLGYGHGSNDAQKTMGIIALALFGATQKGVLDHAPVWMSFLRQPTADVPIWVKVTCAFVMAAGTAGGGWRIIRTMGHRMVRLQPIHGFAAETTAGTILMAAGSKYLGMPVSTTHVVTASIMGVGCAKRFSALNLPVINRILWAWVLTVPAAGVVGYAVSILSRWVS
jgi:PiT family inorganic phosphate transporter